MNDSNEPLPDKLLSDLLKPLREVAVPPSTQASNRVAVQQALEKHDRVPWWRRSIAVPIPLAAAATIALAVTAAALLRPSSPQSNVANDRPPPVENRKTEPASEIGQAADRNMRPPWHVTQSYIQALPSLAGAGNFVESIAKESRDDS